MIKKQINNKIKNANKKFKSSLIEIINSINKKKLKTNFNSTSNNNDQNNSAIMQILKFFKINTKNVPNNLKKLNQKIEFLIKSHSIVSRQIKLSGKWHKTLLNPIIVRTIEHKPVAIVPSKTLGCYWFNPKTQKKIKINNKNKNFFENEATAFFKPLPPGQINFFNLIKYSKELVSWFDCAILFLISLAITMLGLITPNMIKLIFSTIIELQNTKFLAIALIFLFITTLSEHLFSSSKNLICHKIITKITTQIESATIIRVFNMPASFFKKLNPGEILTKINILTDFYKNLLKNSLQTWLKCIFSLAYFFQIFSYSKALAAPTALIIATTIIFCIFAAINRSKIGLKRLNYLAKENAASLELISTIEKIKINNIEKIAFARWANNFANTAKLTYKPPWQLKINTITLSAITTIGNIALCIVAAISKTEPANFFAFSLAYTTIANAFSNLATTILEFAKIKPISKMMKPIFETHTENGTNKKTINNISGAITLNELSFSYSKNLPPVLNKISIEIEPAETVAFVGKTGCAKSTLIRLLVGLETPTKGSIFFDDNNLSSTDLQSLRKKIGIVSQNAGLFNGNIFLNIAATSKHLTLKKAWHAAEIAQIADDIKQMPMKMNTLITQEGNEFSSSQIQRILIARAVACNPKILIFDEATSALDENLQNKIFESINKLECTKIFVTHRISTIERCDRIFVIENGKIAEEGTFTQLINNKGHFYSLIEQNFNCENNSEIV